MTTLVQLWWFHQRQTNDALAHLHDPFHDGVFFHTDRDSADEMLGAGFGGVQCTAFECTPCMKLKNTYLMIRIEYLAL